jgi:hypothetical protein
MLHSRAGSWPHPQPLGYAGNNCQRQTLQLFTKIRKLRTKKFCNIGPRAQGATTLSIIALSTTTFSITTLSIKDSFVILSINDTQHKRLSA